MFNGTLEVGTLAKLEVEPGDVVYHIKYTNGDPGNIESKLIINNACEVCDEKGEPLFFPDSPSMFRIVSRAEGVTELSGDVLDNNTSAYDQTDVPTVFGGMTDAEKGALLLANYYFDEVESFITGEWRLHYGQFHHDVAYRVKPNPVDETVTKS